MQDVALYSIRVTDEHIETIISDLLERMNYDVLRVRHLPSLTDDQPSELRVIVKRQTSALPE